MQVQLVKEIEDFAELLEKFDWMDSYVSEIYIESPSFVDPRDCGLHSPGCLPFVRSTIIAQEKSLPGVELIFGDVSIFGAWFECELDPELLRDKKGEGWIWKFRKGSSEYVRCKSMGFRQLDTSCWGRGSHYGMPSNFDEAGRLIVFDP